MKKIVATSLAACMCLGLMSGCSNDTKPTRDPNSTPISEVKESKLPMKDKDTEIVDVTNTPENSVEPTVEPTPELDPDFLIDPPAQNEANITIDENANTFDEKLISYINNTDLASQNYVLSPLSFKMALSLLTEGADTDTRAELLKILGANDIEALRDLSNKYFLANMEIEKRYADDMEWMEYIGEKVNDEPAPALVVSNSVWKNTNEPGEVLKSYIDVIEQFYMGTCQEVEAENMKDAINTWTNEKTNGMIPSIVDESVAKMNSVLVNAIYLRDGWENEFYDRATKTGDFTDKDGNKVEKEFMNQQDKFKFYKDDETKLVVLPTKYGFDVVYVLGSTENIGEKLAKARSTEVKVRIPKMDVESSFDNGVLVDFMKSAGVNETFTDEADFSKLSTFPVTVSDIIQKAKIKTDEKGIEGAAVTAIMMETAAMEIDPPKPEEFNADSPFTFFVKLSDMPADTMMSDGVIFYGQVIE